MEIETREKHGFIYKLGRWKNSVDVDEYIYEF
jgi:hypothetical protein